MQSNLCQTHAFLVAIFGATLNHIPLKYRCPNKKSNRIRVVDLTQPCRCRWWLDIESSKMCNRLWIWNWVFCIPCKWCYSTSMHGPVINPSDIDLVTIWRYMMLLSGTKDCSSFFFCWSLSALQFCVWLDGWFADLLRSYLKQVREETSGRLMEKVYRQNGTPNKWWLAFAKRKFMNIMMPL